MGGILSPFISLGQAVGENVAKFFTKQGVQTPAQRPISIGGDSFDFASGFQKLIEPVTKALDPKNKAGVTILEGVTKIGSTALNAVGRNIDSYIDGLFQKGNMAPSGALTEATNAVRASDAFGSQYLDLGATLQAISQLKNASASQELNPSADKAIKNNSMILMIGFASLAAVMLLTSRRAK